MRQVIAQEQQRMVRTRNARDFKLEAINPAHYHANRGRRSVGALRYLKYVGRLLPSKEIKNLPGG
jgi:hypothetical protein